MQFSIPAIACPDEIFCQNVTLSETPLCTIHNLADLK
jgi:hypothetical protein